PDVIVHGHNGWLIPPDDPTALHAALLTLLADADLRDRLGRAARERVVADNSLMGVTTKTRAVYDQVWLRDVHE
ncbi:MAG TPA: glycosyltransferase, partial [Anaerolineae bacterium]|nr:glycosyltransferase [Anaerolineae bacterium]